MAKTTDTTIPAELRKRVMRRAWEIFRQSYNYPRVPFRSIGRACFNSALKAAWAEAKQTARLAVLGVAKLKAAAEAAIVPPHHVGLSTSYTDRASDVVARYRKAAAYTAALEFAIAA